MIQGRAFTYPWREPAVSDEQLSSTIIAINEQPEVLR